ncbi:hypothetical protein [Plantibacter sp. RU18]|uniref:hypothetical protein n=1 Tax=Plantibacter sp. RU18 TaxID=3158143 RepID=UPI002D1D67A3|nr:hypothetical protein [Gemmatimonadaceae bacterium]
MDPVDDSTRAAKYVRLHSSIGYLTPVEKENEHYREVAPSTSQCWENSLYTEPGAIHSSSKRIDPRIGTR